MSISFSYLKLNDNHAFRQKVNLKESPLFLDTAFKEWLSSRDDISSYVDRKYPVYIVAAEGGGIYAAAHAAISLGRLSQTDERFSKHLFAISSVSGGSLGAAIYQQLLLQGGAKESVIKDIIAYDFLSPLLVRGLFHDMIQNVLPFPVGIADRARGLEAGFEQSLCTTSSAAGALCKGGKSSFSRSFASHWKPNLDAPALVFNTSQVPSNRRIVIAPFRFHANDTTIDSGGLVAINDLDNNIDLPMSTAIGLSARFPFVTPWGWFIRSKGGQKIFLSDGGFADNSGVQTASDIARVIREVAARDMMNIDIILISIRAKVDAEAKKDPILEYLVPLTLWYSAWKEKSAVIVEQVKKEFPYYYEIVLIDKEKRLPLTWTISPGTIEYIANNSERVNCSESVCGKEALKKLNGN